ncbi:hypothetical protein PHET_04721 [Paragonimus heterotremus]|uniref:Uncharacterized protein n=1 Tax=Paragonimus heterotremus TaxID=100268 RepID=A0A8J4WIA2_9TREM|nr:hypothetical protein PHET_04721 [Paragonimus heterotremus]
MSLSVRIKYLDGLTKKDDRIIKGKFRESKQSTNRANGRDSVYFGQTLLWPVSRPIDDRDVLELSAYNYRKHLPGSLLGTITVNLFSLTRENRMSLRENLVDGSNRPTSVSVAWTESGVDDNLDDLLEAERLIREEDEDDDDQDDSVLPAPEPR